MCISKSYIKNLRYYTIKYVRTNESKLIKIINDFKIDMFVI